MKLTNKLQPRGPCSNLLIPIMSVNHWQLIPLACGCNPTGSESSVCDTTIGQCSCLPNVSGMRCDQCQLGFYGLDTPSGCMACNCDPVGSMGEQCDESGACMCRPGVTGRSCDSCLPGHFGLSASGCEGIEVYNFVYHTVWREISVGLNIRRLISSKKFKGEIFVDCTPLI